MKTKLGISAGALAAIAYLTGFFSGYLVLVLIVGYVFIAEDNDWLKINTVKALAVTLAFSILTALIGFIPNIISIINSLFGIWGSYFSIAPLSSSISFINNCISVCEKVLMLLLALKAFKLETIKIGCIDNLIAKHIVKE